MGKKVLPKDNLSCSYSSCWTLINSGCSVNRASFLDPFEDLELYGHSKKSLPHRDFIFWRMLCKQLPEQHWRTRSAQSSEACTAKTWRFKVSSNHVWLYQYVKDLNLWKLGCSVAKNKEVATGISYRGKKMQKHDKAVHRPAASAVRFRSRASH